MPSYGSDDDDDSIQDYTVTKVLLGYAEEEANDDAISHLGGEPTWPHPSSPADARLAKCACCNRLMSLLLQLNGAIPESPHERMFYVFACKEKTCRRKRGSVKALRGVKLAAGFEGREKKQLEEEQQRKEKEKTKAKAVPRAGEILFGFGNPFSTETATAGNPFSTATATTGNPFSTATATAGNPVSTATATAGSPFSTATATAGNPFSTATATAGNPFSAPASANPFSTAPPPTTPKPAAPSTAELSKSFADTLRISSPSAPKEPEPLFYGPSEPWPSPLPHQYPLFYFEADYETLVPDRPPPPQKITELLESDDTPVSNSDVDDGVLDTAFQSFADRVGQNPEQVLRYERGGTPLLYSYDDEVAKTLLVDGKFSTRRLPACAGCGKRERIFEFQLMPHAITVLEGESLSLDGMEWGTVVVATCACTPQVRDANGVGWVDEWVGVQWESQK